MKKITILLMVLLVIGLVSCKDTKNTEDEKTKAAVEQIEAIETKIDELSSQINEDAKALEIALKELDNI